MISTYFDVKFSRINTTEHILPVPIILQLPIWRAAKSVRHALPGLCLDNVSHEFPVAIWLPRIQWKYSPTELDQHYDRLFHQSETQNKCLFTTLWTFFITTCDQQRGGIEMTYIRRLWNSQSCHSWWMTKYNIALGFPNAEGFPHQMPDGGWGHMPVFGMPLQSASMKCW